ncbi:hypothetical protein JCM5296_001249 [Sporobolomyces johnsonii]
MLPRLAARPPTQGLRSVPRSTPLMASRVKMVANHFSSSSSSSASNPSTSDPHEPASAPVLFEAIHSLRKITLNRPKALNSLNDDMVDLIQPQLEKFEQSDLANVVLIKSNSKHFCAGGDVVSLVKALDNKKSWKKASGFFQKEYTMNHFLATMSKPVVSFMHGVAFGGGLGLSMHGAFRVATETTQVAMPETKIGLFPDVGANFFLPRLDGQLGLYLALTSSPLKGAGAYFAGFSTHYVPSERLAALEARLAELEPNATLDTVNSVIDEYAADADELKLALKEYPLVGSIRRALDLIFAGRTAEDILANLKKLEEGALDMGTIVREGEQVDMGALQKWAKETREQIELRSPTSVKLAIKAIREGRKLNIDEVFTMDTRIAAACCSPEVHTDFKTGVTEFLIKKIKPEDVRPPWSPSTLPEVTDAHIQRTFFASPPPFTNPPVAQLDLSRKDRVKALPPYRTSPHARFALPSENRIAEVVRGEAKDSGDYAMTRREVVERFVHEFAGKVGVREKVEEVLDRRTVVGEQDTLRWV